MVQSGQYLVLQSRVVGSIPSRKPWSCIFCQLVSGPGWGLKCIYIFLTLEFTLLKEIYLLTMSANAKYYL